MSKKPLTVETSNTLRCNYCGRTEFIIEIAKGHKWGRTTCNTCGERGRAGKATVEKALAQNVRIE